MRISSYFLCKIRSEVFTATLWPCDLCAQSILYMADSVIFCIFSIGLELWLVELQNDGYKLMTVRLRSHRHECESKYESGFQFTAHTIFTSTTGTFPVTCTSTELIIIVWLLSNACLLTSPLKPSTTLIFYCVRSASTETKYSVNILLCAQCAPLIMNIQQWQVVMSSVHHSMHK